MPNQDGSYQIAGFWRRLAAAIIDAMIIAVPIQILVVFLFSLTNGAIQFHNGITYKDCSHKIEITQLPHDLQPLPPQNPTSAFVCRTTLFGLTTAETLTVARVTKNGNVTHSETASYALGKDGLPRVAISLDGWAALLIFIYLVASETVFGKTLGKRFLGIRVVDHNAPTAVGIPIKKAISRHLLIWAGALPMLFVILVFNPRSEINESIFPWLAVTGFVFMIWAVWNVVLAARKHDPIYDRVSRTSVIRMGI
jgi:uncharacterized RDD family membrane protein YckC